jgi:hypothetical protein
MKLNKTWKVIIGILTLIAILAPFFYVMGVFMVIGESFFLMMGDPSTIPSEEEVFLFMKPIFYMMPLMMLGSMLQFAMSIFYLIHVILNKEGTDLLRILLGIGAFFLPYIAMPFYYFVYIFPETPPDWALVKKNEAA